MINSDNSYKRDDKDEDSKSEIDKKDKSFNTIDKEDFLPLLKPVRVVSTHYCTVYDILKKDKGKERVVSTHKFTIRSE